MAENVVKAESVVKVESAVKSTDGLFSRLKVNPDTRTVNNLQIVKRVNCAFRVVKIQLSVFVVYVSEKIFIKA